MRFRFRETTQTGYWALLCFAHGRLMQCEHPRSPAGFCAPCGDTLERRALNAQLRAGVL